MIIQKNRIIVISLFIIEISFFYEMFKDNKENIFINGSFLVVYLLSIILHEISHAMVAKLYGYSILYIRILGWQIMFKDNNFRITFTMDWLLEANIMCEYFVEVDSEDKLDIFYEKLKKITVAGPICSLFMFLGAFFCAIVYKNSVLSLTIMVINGLILISSFIKTKDEIGDLELYTNFEKYKEYIFMCISIKQIRKDNLFIQEQKSEIIRNLLNKKE